MEPSEKGSSERAEEVGSESLLAQGARYVDMLTESRFEEVYGWYWSRYSTLTRKDAST